MDISAMYVNIPDVSISHPQPRLVRLHQNNEFQGFLWYSFGIPKEYQRNAKGIPEDPLGAPVDSVGIPKESYGIQWIP